MLLRQEHRGKLSIRPWPVHAGVTERTRPYGRAHRDLLRPRAPFGIVVDGTDLTVFELPGQSGYVRRRAESESMSVI